MERIRAVYPLPSDDQTSEQGQDERSLGGPSDPLDPQEAPSEAPQSHRVNPLSSQEEAPAGSHPMGLMGHRGLQTPVLTLVPGVVSASRCSCERCQSAVFDTDIVQGTLCLSTL